MSESMSPRELRDWVGAVLRRVAKGKSFTITVRGEPVAEIIPLRRPRRLVPRAQVVELLAGRPADPALLERAARRHPGRRRG